MRTIQEEIIKIKKADGGPLSKRITSGIRLMSDGSVEVYSDPLRLETWRFVEGKWQR